MKVAYTSCIAHLHNTNSTHAGTNSMFINTPIYYRLATIICTVPVHSTHTQIHIKRLHIIIFYFILNIYNITFELIVHVLRHRDFYFLPTFKILLNQIGQGCRQIRQCVAHLKRLRLKHLLLWVVVPPAIGRVLHPLHHVRGGKGWSWQGLLLLWLRLSMCITRCWKNGARSVLC
jgi:hypothetical protein